uniref:Putative ovule protein n=1 Tax=Solanum chacoense TaxID=4108 RepID=A0A0V0I508_SOLCH
MYVFLLCFESLFNKLSCRKPLWAFLDGWFFQWIDLCFWVVRVRSTCPHHNKHHNEFEVYSLKSDSWRSIHCLKDELLFTEVGKFVNGKLHWATCDGHLHEGWSISSIDLSCEEWGVVELPCYGEGNGVFSLGV